MADRFPGGVISKTPPTVTGPAPGSGGSASGVWTLDEVLGYQKAGAWPGAPLLFIRELYAWGTNSFGQVGDGTIIAKSSPVQIGALSNWASSDAFRISACVTQGGTLFTWGDNSTYGQLGHNNRIDRSSPVQVGALTNWSQVSCGFFHTACVKTDGTLWSWGHNTNGQLGQGNVIARSSPVQVGALTNWAQVSLGSFHSICITTAGTLFAWGQNTGNGQLGVGDTISKSSPVQIGALTNWAQASAGDIHTACVKTDGTLFTWGSNQYGKLGHGLGGGGGGGNKSSPVQVGALTNWSQVACGYSHTACITTAGTLFTWGHNTNGQLGQGNVIARSSPVQVGALTNWSEVSVWNHTACITTAGTLFTWGRGTSGQLGHNNIINLSSPVQVGALTNWSQVTAGQAHTVVILEG